MLNQFTYSQLRKPESRKEIKENHIASIGTQAGQFGVFNEDVRVVSKKGADAIKREIACTAVILGVDYETLIKTMPTLAQLID